MREADLTDAGALASLTTSYTGTNLTDQVSEATAGVVGLPVVGTSGNDALTGTSGADALDGLDGDDILDGGAGDDLLYGGPGRDVLIGGPGKDLLDGGAGFDKADYSAATGGVAVNLAAGAVIGDASVGTDTLRSIETIRGSSFADSYDATGFSADSLNGGGFGYVMAGGQGPQGTVNEFEGGAGDDTITGNGNTRISYRNATAAVTVDLALGVADGDASVGHDTILGGVNAVRGSSFGDVLIGSQTTGSATETFEGAGGNDLIDGKGAEHAAGSAARTAARSSTVSIGGYGRLALGRRPGAPRRGRDAARVTGVLSPAGRLLAVRAGRAA